MKTITGIIKNDFYEEAIAVAYGFGMSGCSEDLFDSDTKITFYFSDDSDIETIKNELAKYIENLTIDNIEDNQDWNAKWRESMEPALIADGIWVSPTWLEPPTDGRNAWIKIEPKMAFGTGHHETTRLASKQLINLKNALAGKTILDIGTGSGVLCFVANLVGARYALGVEIDPVCRENLAENLRDNPPAKNSKINFLIANTNAININAKNENQKFDAVIMNMLITESAPLLDFVVSVLKNNGLLIWSGILCTEREEVFEAVKKFDLKLCGELIENEWWSGVFCN